MRQNIYLDYAATTPVDPAVADAMTACLTLDGNFANPASRSHGPGWMAEEAVDIARHQIADLVNVDGREIIFTSGATESTNIALKGAVEASAAASNHIITVRTEHKATIDTCEYLQSQGVDVTFLTPDSTGLISLEQLDEALQSNTLLVSVMHVNNETGVIQNIQAIALWCQSKGVLMHCDAAQSTGKCKLDLAATPIDLMSFSAHKTYGPKGIGALFVRRSPRVKVAAQMHGGAHERGYRSGTLPTHQIVGMGKAFELAGEVLVAEQARLTEYRDILWNVLQHLPDVHLNGHPTERVANTLNISFGKLDSQQLMPALAPLAVSSGSACTSATMTPSYVLTAMGIEDAYANSALRLSLGRFTTAEEVNFAAQHIFDVVTKLAAR